MWSSMLDSVASGKRLPERNVFVLGGQKYRDVHMDDLLIEAQEAHLIAKRSSWKLYLQNHQRKDPKAGMEIKSPL